eukprot:816495-Pleurochrysis_carterae.AAC.2
MVSNSLPKLRGLRPGRIPNDGQRLMPHQHRNLSRWGCVGVTLLIIAATAVSASFFLNARFASDSNTASSALLHASPSAPVSPPLPLSPSDVPPSPPPHLPPAFPVQSPSSGTNSSLPRKCGSVLELVSGGPFAALVRSVANTEAGDGLQPTCASANAAGDCVDSSDSCDGSTLEVVSNSRSYLLQEYDSACEGIPFGNDNYSCVDYTEGQLILSGRELSFDVDLSATGCGCNAAVYLASMAQNPDPSTCKDYYCDANSVCGVRCDELDLMEANRWAFIATAHTRDDGNGVGFGLGHYVLRKESRFRPSEVCPYGPATTCTINTLGPFTARYKFTSADQPFSYNLTLVQGKQSITAGPVAYQDPEANARLRKSLDAGMILVVSNWDNLRTNGMQWLDGCCTPEEVSVWGCSNTFNELGIACCEANDNATAACPTFTLTNMSVA